MITAGKFTLFAPMLSRSHEQRRPRKVREMFAEATKEQLATAARKFSTCLDGVVARYR